LVAEVLRRDSGSRWLACRDCSSRGDDEVVDVLSGRWW
jgi:hypothetical protein